MPKEAATKPRSVLRVEDLRAPVEAIARVERHGETLARRRIRGEQQRIERGGVEAKRRRLRTRHPDAELRAERERLSDRLARAHEEAGLTDGAGAPAEHVVGVRVVAAVEHERSGQEAKRLRHECERAERARVTPGLGAGRALCLREAVAHAHRRPHVRELLRCRDGDAPEAWEPGGGGSYRRREVGGRSIAGVGGCRRREPQDELYEETARADESETGRHARTFCGSQPRAHLAGPIVY